ncbi:integral membrane sensor signal transduction histidine kinase [Clostridium bornimense]|uniref:histidine kinase n=1 Tax=Clostridium bornimense TaxID=1216932 RepID=W6S3L8_9CLOT|nr:HAMP domain-containing sensor histidine kinase [Clostridium bornimense]CDM68912.1 integral membrane sensor signal transduction histidine kinase [Clostridium bornimense]
MNKNHYIKLLKLWFPFIINVFITFTITYITTLIIIFIYAKQDSLPSPSMGFTLIIVISILIGLFFTIFIGLMIHNFIKPINKIIESAEKVAKGDFSIHLDESVHKEEIRDMYISFNKMVRELNSIETLRNDFIVNVSHEFKTPLSSIEGYATLLQSPNITEEERIEYSKIIIESSKQLSSLTGNILTLSKLETQEILPESVHFNLDEQIRQALLILENKWCSKNIDINLDFDMCSYYGNEKLLMQVWLNLLENAIKFTSNGGTITASVKEHNEYICITISDTGIGMSKETQQYIFDKFYQGDKTHTIDGNGLGLALVKRIIDLYNGTITVKSAVNKGSTFIVSLPKNYN